MSNWTTKYIKNHKNSPGQGCSSFDFSSIARISDGWMAFNALSKLPEFFHMIWCRTTSTSNNRIFTHPHTQSMVHMEDQSIKHHNLLLALVKTQAIENCSLQPCWCTTFKQHWPHAGQHINLETAFIQNRMLVVQSFVLCAPVAGPLCHTKYMYQSTLVANTYCGFWQVAPIGTLRALSSQNDGYDCEFVCNY